MEGTRPGPDTFHIATSNRDFAVGCAGNVVIAVWRGQTKLEYIKEALEVIENITAKHPGNCAFVSVIEPTSETPGGDARRISKETFEKIGKKLNCSAVVVEESGMRTAAIRLIMSAMTAFSETNKTFSTVRQAHEWIVSTIEHVPPTLVSDAERVRAAIKK